MRVKQEHLTISGGVLYSLRIYIYTWLIVPYILGPLVLDAPEPLCIILPLPPSVNCVLRTLPDFHFFRLLKRGTRRVDAPPKGFVSKLQGA